MAEWSRGKDGFGKEIDLLELEDGDWYTVNGMASESGFRIFKNGTLYAQEATREIAKLAVERMAGITVVAEPKQEPEVKAKPARKAKAEKPEVKIYDGLVEDVETA